MADEHKQENKLSPPTVKAAPEKSGSVFDWARNTYYYFFVLFTFGLILSNTPSTLKEVKEIWMTTSSRNTTVTETRVEERGTLSCNACKECTEQMIGQTRTRVSLAETFPGYRKALRVCHQGNTFKAFVKRGGEEVEMTFGPQNESSFTSEDWKEFYLVGDSGSAISICKCNN